MIGLGQLLTLAGSVLVGSAVPFLPTGELVSGAAALVSNSALSVCLIFVAAWVCSVLGDTLLLLEVRLFRGPLQAWLGRRRFGGRVSHAQDGLAGHALKALVTARLIPGARAPLVIALGLGRFPLRQFVLFDTAACALWAAIFATIGSVGGSLTNNPLWGMVIAIAMAVSMAVAVHKLGHLVPGWQRGRAGSAADSATDDHALVRAA